MLRFALARGISVAASHVGTIHSLDTPLAELLRLMEQAAAAFQAGRRQQAPKMLAGAVGANGLDGTSEVQAA